MDNQCFDRLARMIGITTSRRGIQALVLAGMTAFVVDRGQGAGAKNKKKKVELCLFGQTLTVGKKAKRRYLAQGATLGACAVPSSPPPPPPAAPAFCAAKNACVADAPCNAAGPQCNCFPRADAGHIGEPICGQSQDTAESCEGCPDGTICVLGGGMCAAAFICVTACPNPL
jgi:hypothetical protein